MKNANTPAFGKLEQAGDLSVKDGGLTKREYFASMAMQGLCASPDMRDARTEANLAVKLAGALLEELERTNEPD